MRRHLVFYPPINSGNGSQSNRLSRESCLQSPLKIPMCGWDHLTEMLQISNYWASSQILEVMLVTALPALTNLLETVFITSLWHLYHGDTLAKNFFYIVQIIDPLKTIVFFKIQTLLKFWNEDEHFHTKQTYHITCMHAMDRSTTTTTSTIMTTPQTTYSTTSWSTSCSGEGFLNCHQV